MQYGKSKYKDFYIFHGNEMIINRDDCVFAFNTAMEKADSFVKKDNLIFANYDYHGLGRIRVSGYFPISDDVLILKHKKFIVSSQKIEKKRKLLLKQAKIVSKKDAMAEITRLKNKFKIK